MVSMVRRMTAWLPVSIFIKTSNHRSVFKATFSQSQNETQLHVFMDLKSPYVIQQVAEQTEDNQGEL